MSGLLNCDIAIDSGVTPIGQDWTNARGLRGLGGPKPDPKFCLFDFTSHFIIVLCLMVILVSILIIINSSINSKWGMGYEAFYVICPRASSQYVTPLAIDLDCACKFQSTIFV